MIRLLGIGGMGAVYQAWDDALGVSVALKVIRPQLSPDPAAAADLERRFKRELLLARQVTHKNVVRIHDLGEINGITYITMPYIDGQDLAAVLKESGTLPVSKAVAIAKQFAAGLQAAHDVGVVHRDLKPANIMIDEGRALIMDFGIAHSVSTAAETMLTGGTIEGSVIGTLEYMAPEQARGEAVDHRADIYAFGLIFCEMLVGRRQGTAGGSTISDLMRRMLSPPPLPRTIDPAIPEVIDQVISRCVQPDPAARYQTTAELCDDLDLLDADGHAQSSLSQPSIVTGPLPTPAASKLRLSRTWIAAAALVMMAIAALVARQWNGQPPTETAAAPGPPPISLAILPLRNASPDRSLDWLGASLAEMLRTEVGQSAHLRSISSDRLHQILQDLHIAPDATLDAATLRRLAEFSNAETILWGSYVKLGDTIRIDATLGNMKRQSEVPLKVEAANQAGVFAAVAQLAHSIRQNLALSPDIIKELQQTSFKPSTESLDALRYYNEGLQLARQGKHSDALKAFQTSIAADGNFALAYSRLAQAHANLGYDSEAQQSSRNAVDRADKLPPPERYLILANHARIANDNTKAIESYENLARVSPEDAEVHFNLAGLYEAVGSYDLAHQSYSKVLARDPNHVDALFRLGRVEIWRGNAKGSLEPLSRAHNLAIQLETDEARADILNATGVAYGVLDKPDEALRYYQQSLDIKRRLGQKRGIALTLNNVARIQDSEGQLELALKSYQEALQLQREIGDQAGLSTTLLNLGSFYENRARYDEALKLFKESLQIQREVGNENLQALGLNNIGNIYLFKGDYDDALTYFERALQLREKLKVPREIADTLHNLAETFINLGRYDEALRQYVRALEIRRTAGDKRGTAIESYSIGTLFGYQGRFAAALKSKEDALKDFRALQERSFWLAEILSGHGQSLSQIGRSAEAEKSFTEAMALAGELRNQALVAQTLNFQGEDALYRGDVDAARGLFARALKEASGTTDRRLQLISRVNVAKAVVHHYRAGAGSGGQSGERTGAAAAKELKTVIATLRELARQADALGLKYLSVQCSIALGETLLLVGEQGAGRKELGRAIVQGENLELRALLATAHHVLGQAGLSASEAARHAVEARRLLDEIRKEAGSDDVMKRADLRAIQEATASARATMR